MGGGTKLVIWMQSSRKYSETQPIVNSRNQRPNTETQRHSVLTATLNGEGPSKDLDDGTVEEVFSEHAGVDGGRHEDDADVGEGLDHVSEDNHQEVCLQRHRQTQDR